MPRFTPTDIVSQYSAISALNANFDAVATLLELCLLRDGTSPNQMLAALNMNNFKIQNVADGVDASDAVNKGQMDEVVDAAEAFADAAATSASSASTQAAAASLSASAAAASAAAANHSSGTYTPVSSSLTNLTQATMQPSFYTRVGNIVTVTFFSVVDGQVDTLSTSFLITLPVASNLASASDLVGCAATQMGPSAIVTGDVAGDKAEVFWTATSAGGGWVTGTFQYEVQ